MSELTHPSALSRAGTHTILHSSMKIKCSDSLILDHTTPSNPIFTFSGLFLFQFELSCFLNFALLPAPLNASHPPPLLPKLTNPLSCCPKSTPHPPLFSFLSSSMASPLHCSTYTVINLQGPLDVTHIASKCVCARMCAITTVKSQMNDSKYLLCIFLLHLNT